MSLDPQPRPSRGWGDGLGGGAALDIAGFLGGGDAPLPPSDIWALLAPRTAEELAAYDSGDDDGAWEAAIEGFGGVVVRAAPTAAAAATVSAP